MSERNALALAGIVLTDAAYARIMKLDPFRQIEASCAYPACGCYVDELCGVGVERLTKAREVENV